MTWRNTHVQCDSCNAVAPGSEQHGWETVAGTGEIEAHLCPACVDLRERGELVTNPLGIRCVRCGRSPADGLKQWWVARGEEGQAVDVCDDCLDDDHDVVVP
jgi:hypothetical protein